MKDATILAVDDNADCLLVIVEMCNSVALSSGVLQTVRMPLAF